MTDLPKVSYLTPDQVRVMVAEAVGWKSVDPSGMAGKPSPLLWYRGSFDWNTAREKNRLPDYPNDLNAMAEVEKTLTDEEYGNFVFELREITCRWKTFSATAFQRAAAFLVAKGRARL